MLKVLRPLKDAYITDRWINGSPVTGSNVGAAGSLDLYKLYGYTSTAVGNVQIPNVELTRLLVQFDLAPLRQLVAAGKVDPTNPSFSCRIHLSDVYAGQPTPTNFTVVAYPLSASFDEGLGRDVVFYTDLDVCSWQNASLASGSWFVTGCGLGGDDRGPCDYLTASRGVQLGFFQTYITGEEDLDIDVTPAVSATLAGLVPDSGFRISLTPSLEQDAHSYFVKRFASRTAYNEDKRPKMLVRFDDSVQDDTSNMYLDSAGYMFLYNYVRSAPANLTSGSSPVTGSNCLLLQLTTPVSGGTFSLAFTGSQHFSGINPQVGIYSASVSVLSSIPQLAAQWQASGSVTFTPTWGSLDGTVPYLTGAAVKFNLPQRGDRSISPRRFEVTVQGVRDRVGCSEQAVLRVNIFDYTSPYLLQATRLPVELPGVVVRDVHYQVRDAVTRQVVIPFDVVTNSTRASNDSTGMYFKLDASNLTPGHTYVIDVLVVTGDGQQLYEAASVPFKVDAAA